MTLHIEGHECRTGEVQGHITIIRIEGKKKFSYLVSPEIKGNY